jgi:hypothetical protein
MVQNIVCDLASRFGKLADMADAFGQLKTRVANTVERFGGARRAMEDAARIANNPRGCRSPRSATPP